MSVSAGTRLGPYEIVAATGAGGMGKVYKARDTRLDRTVAIKILPAGLASDPQCRQRLEREARAISQLTQPRRDAAEEAASAQQGKRAIPGYLAGRPLDRLRLERIGPERSVCADISRPGIPTSNFDQR
jgi:serine/threonine protein kinase